MADTQSALDALKKKSSEDSKTSEPEAESDSPNEEMFQHYESSRTSMRLITPKGDQIVFTQFGYATQNKDIIEYLDSEIAAGMKEITKGELLSLKASDPVEALRAKFRAEWEKEQEEKQKLIDQQNQERQSNTTGMSTTNQVAR